jgi:hypothetical protein
LSIARSLALFPKEGARMSDVAKYHWYVTYSYSSKNASGEGSTVCTTTENWFPLGKIYQSIKLSNGNDALVIQNWRRITERQTKEYKVEAKAKREGEEG